MKLTSTAILLALATSAFAHDANVEMAKAANALLATLTPEQKAKATFPFESDAKGERMNWHFIPRERKGLPIKEMTEPQVALARALLKTGLSDDGYKKADVIQSLEAILREMEKDTTGKRDPLKYYVSIFGTPGAKVWAWRWEGHHQSFNYTSAGDAAPSMTPSFFGTNPGEVREGEFLDLRDDEAESVFRVWFRVGGDRLLRGEREQRAADAEEFARIRVGIHFGGVREFVADFAIGRRRRRRSEVQRVADQP